jgi:nicotinate-nucleotide pyrophosphorylase (carboxylating)
MIPADLLSAAITANVNAALAEDIGTGDITANLISESATAEARILTRETMILAGRPWAEAILQQVDPRIHATWSHTDGDTVAANTIFLTLTGPARSLLTAERSILNFIQVMSGTATEVSQLVKLLEGTQTKLLDTRKTLPGLRIAQKYAVAVGGGKNHRLGLFDAFLIKENHIMACGGIKEAILQARQIAPGKPVEVETETLEEHAAALEAGADIIMLDDFSMADMALAVQRTQGRAKLEASGGITRQNLRTVAETGVDYISMGAITKDVKAIDLSMRFLG